MVKKVTMRPSPVRSKNPTDSWVRSECCVGVGGRFGEVGHDGDDVLDELADSRRSVAFLNARGASLPLALARRLRYKDERTMGNAYRIVGVPIRAAQATGQNSRVVPESANWREKVVA